MHTSDQQSKKTSKPRKKRNTKHIWKGVWVVVQVLLVLGLMGVIFAGAVAAGFFASHVQDERLRDYEEIYNGIYNLNRTGEAYFSNNELIGYLRTAEVSKPVSIDEVSPHLVNAILAIEDHIFYEHKGINPRAITRAVLEMFLTGGEGTGGSTITQQLVKNQLLDASRSFERKFKEILLAMRVERMFGKNEILEAYMNIAYMGYNANGSNIEGVQAAAEGIFGVDAADLNLPQAAYLAGMIHSPGRYTPFTRAGVVVEERLERGIERMTTVLRRMLEVDMITQAEFDEALAFDLRRSLAKPTPGIVERYPYLTFEIERRVIDILMKTMLEEQGLEFDSLSEEDQGYYRDIARRQMSQGGYKIYTTIDRELYEAFHEIAQNPEYFGARSSRNTYTKTDPETGDEIEIGYLEQTAATLIDNQTGAIIAMIEGRDFEELQYNLTTEPRQPGSSIKPLLDYAPAFELGILQPASIIDDSPIFKWDVSRNDYWIPRNFNGDYLGLMTVREALNRSYNIPAIKAFLKVQEEAGAEVPFDFLKKMGISTVQPQDYHAPSVSIGGFTYGLTVEENTNAYSVFANNGVLLEAYMIEKIEDHEGQVVYQHEIRPQQVFSEQTAFLINDLLRTVVNHGTGASIRRELGPGLDVAGKTGTTNDEFDYWFVGYTPQISLGLWSGYDKRETLQRGYSSRNHHLWVTLLNTVQEIRPDLVDPERRFEMPSDIVRATVCSKSGMLPSDLCREAGFLVEDYFNRQFLPTEVDDKLIEARLVTVDGKTYLAHESTPDDLVSTGIYVQRDPLEIPESLESQRQRYLPRDWELALPEETDPREENGKNPDQPSGIQISRVEGGIEIRWNPVQDNDIAGYRIFRAGRDGEFAHIGSVQDHLPKSYIDSTADSGQEYAYYVVAVDIAGNVSEPSRMILSNQTDPDGFFGPGEGSPSAPTGLEGRKALFGVELSWLANDADEHVEHYTIYYSTNPQNGFQPLATTSGTRYTHSFFNVPDSFWYYITATNASGESEASATIRVTFTDQDDDPVGNPDPPSGDQNGDDDDENIIDQLP